MEEETKLLALTERQIADARDAADRIRRGYSIDEISRMSIRYLAHLEATLTRAMPAATAGAALRDAAEALIAHRDANSAQREEWLPHDDLPNGWWRPHATVIESKYIAALRAALHPAAAQGKGEHDWFTPDFIDYECCRKCGIVRRRDGKNKPCPGIVGISLRRPSARGGQ